MLTDVQNIVTAKDPFLAIYRQHLHFKQTGHGFATRKVAVHGRTHSEVLRHQNLKSFAVGTPRVCVLHLTLVHENPYWCCYFIILLLLFACVVDNVLFYSCNLDLLLYYYYATVICVCCYFIILLLFFTFLIVVILLFLLLLFVCFGVILLRYC